MGSGDKLAEFDPISGCPGLPQIYTAFKHDFKTRRHLDPDSVTKL
jgi:hypothetical protein